VPDEGSTNGHHAKAANELIVAHTSDLHFGARGGVTRDVPALRSVLDASEAAGAQVLILAGDIFDSHRAGEPLVDELGAILADSPLRMVLLPGNHDPGIAEGVYHRRALSALRNLHILGVNAGSSVQFDDLDLEIAGTPHLDYVDMTPLDGIGPRTRGRHIVVAHGHWVRGAYDEHRSWLIHDHEINATGADYVALGHWDVPQPAGDGTVPAYYSGSPDIAKSINIVRISDDGTDVRRVPLQSDSERGAGRS
jgi:DNA repair exonuclease SbcCD nuclease subunit